MDAQWRIWQKSEETWVNTGKNPYGSHQSFPTRQEAEDQAEKLRESPFFGEIAVTQEGTYPEPDDEGNAVGLELETDTSVGDWIVKAAQERQMVICVIPPGFDDYARIFHPAWSERPQVRFGLPTVTGDPVRWSDVAAANGKVAHPEMEWASITGHWRYFWGHGTQPGLWDHRPREGSLSQQQIRELARILAPHTGTPERCVFGIWEGYGEARAQWPESPSLPLPPDRSIILLTGPLSAASTSFVYQEFFERSPSMWWPEDRAWCVGTDVDDQSTYVGASHACIDAILDQPSLEAMRLTPDQALDFGPDRINPEPEGTYPYG